MPDNKVKVSNFTMFLWNLGFLLLVLAADIGLIVGDIYLESGGLKLIFQNLKWPKEINAILALLGIPPTYVTPPIIFGFLITIVSIATTFLLAHWVIGVIGTTQGILKNLTKNKQSGQRYNLISAFEEGHTVLQPVLFGLITAGIMFIFIFPKWTLPIAQLQLASKIWQADFTPQIQGDSIGAVQTVVPDMKVLLEKHSGEFSSHIITGFPIALLMVHILIAFLTEIFMQYTLNHIGSFETRHGEVVRNIRLRLTNLFRRERVARENPTFSSAERRNDEETSESGCTNKNEEQGTINRVEDEHVGNNGGNGNGNNPAEESPIETAVKPEDTDVRVIGGSEAISPADAEKMPELYHVQKNIDSETGEVSYLVYTREFYEKLQKQEVNV